MMTLPPAAALPDGHCSAPRSKSIVDRSVTKAEVWKHSWWAGTGSNRRPCGFQPGSARPGPSVCAVFALLSLAGRQPCHPGSSGSVRLGADSSGRTPAESCSATKDHSLDGTSPRDRGAYSTGSPASAAASVSPPRFGAGAACRRSGRYACCRQPDPVISAGRSGSGETTPPAGAGGATAGRSPAEANRTAGSSTCAETPPNQEWRSWTLMPYRDASRPTTWKPIILDTAMSAANGAASRLLALDQLGFTHPDPAVLDLEHVTAAGRTAGDLHRGVGRGERGGILDQLGEQMGDVADGLAGQREVMDTGNLHAGVCLDLSQRGLDHVAQRYRLAPAAALLHAREHDQVLRVAPHASGEMVDAEQLLEPVRVDLAPLQLVDQLQLPVDQSLATSGKVMEQVADALAQRRLLGDIADVQHQPVDAGIVGEVSADALHVTP